MSIAAGARAPTQESEVNRFGATSPKHLIRAALFNEQTSSEFNFRAPYFQNIKYLFKRAVKPLLAALLIAPSQAQATQLSHDDFMKLAAQCAPALSPVTLEAVARTESNLDPWDLRDNTTGQTYEPNNLSDATLIAEQWVARGDSVDVGLMQINSKNFGALTLTPETALDPCRSLVGGAAILHSAYGGGNTTAEQQAALLMALSRYNTGSPFEGIMDGYARTVLDNAGTETQPELPSNTQVMQFTDPDAPPLWNISATSAYVQEHGAPWLIEFEPSSKNVTDTQTSNSR